MTVARNRQPSMCSPPIPAVAMCSEPLPLPTGLPGCARAVARHLRIEAHADLGDVSAGFREFCDDARFPAAFDLRHGTVLDDHFHRPRKIRITVFARVRAAETGN